MLISVHMIQNYAPSNLNRDGDGSPKSCQFGGVKRARISSQCLKRAIRQSDLFREELHQYGFGVRSRMLPAVIGDRLRERGLSEEFVKIAVEKTWRMLAKKQNGEEQENESSGENADKNAKKKRASGASENPREFTKQLIYFTPSEVEHLTDILFEAAQKAKNASDFKKFELEKSIKNIEHFRITPDMALSGRMSTSSAFVEIESSLQVAHAISTHKMEHEFDFFAAVDDLIDSTVNTSDKSGAGIIGDTEYTSACFYKYFNIHFDGLVENLLKYGGPEQTRNEAEELARKIVRAFLNAAILVSPSGKQNSFAAFELPEAILVEVVDRNLPIAYANAFAEPVRVSRDKNLIGESVQKFVNYVEKIGYKYSLNDRERLWFSLEEYSLSNAKHCDTLNQLLDELDLAIQRRVHK